MIQILFRYTCVYIVLKVCMKIIYMYSETVLLFAQPGLNLKVKVQRLLSMRSVAPTWHGWQL